MGRSPLVATVKWYTLFLLWHLWIKKCILSTIFKKCSSVVFRIETSVETTFSFVVCLCSHAYLSVSFIRDKGRGWGFFERPLGSGENSRAKSWWGLWLVNDGLWGIEASSEMWKESEQDQGRGKHPLAYNGIPCIFLLSPPGMISLLCFVSLQKTNFMF